MLEISIIGDGNVGSHFADAIHNTEGLLLSYHYIRSKPNTGFSDLLNVPCDICILCVSDSSIANISEKLIDKDCLVVHTSGAVGIEKLRSRRKGACYPLQTFRKGIPVNWREIPICIEASCTEDLQLLKKLGYRLSGTVLEFSSEKRLALHLAAVFANNFTNALYACAYDICKDHKIDPEILHPLMMKTIENAISNAPRQVQTGPAKRRDLSTQKRHLELLGIQPKAIYTLMSQFIRDYNDR